MKNMVSSTKAVTLTLAFLSLLLTIAHSECTDLFKELILKRNLTNCRKLATLEAEIGWNYYIQNKIKIDVFFGVRMEENLRWLAWGVNPRSEAQMVGTRAIIGIIEPNGSLAVETYLIASNTKVGCQLLPSVIDVEVKNKEVESSKKIGHITLSATLFLPTEVYNISRLNHAWQVGYSADGLEPKIHPATLQNFDSAETINLITAKSHGIGHHRHHFRKAHGILNIVGWGILLPIGVIIARYYRKFPFHSKWWYIFHVSCQCVGYTLGTTGWGIGLWLGHVSKHYTFRTHRTLSIFIFTFTTLQMLAIRLKPKPHDDYRKYWDMYHHFLGYALLAVISVNIFKGIDILKPDNAWKWGYIGVLGVLALVALVFEIVTWIKFIKSKKDRKKNQHTVQQS
ncbi:hypothetical protein FNV43_RR03856 [Rhamnella rubrinervis]|uniref:Cytochrome b561 and DOMON domain-containing protein n=1 Tax=Rhamnella rubrinervis TaxID=2594499 RepID=A0A8K0HJ60_9ROSA|nr:hypothetical protein FNV43_RR03856 [Rhamnella rubrinervis]